MYDGVLRLNLPAGCNIIEFADGIALVSVGKKLADTTERCSAAADLAEPKSEAVLISSKKVESRDGQDKGGLNDDWFYDRPSVKL